MKKITISLFSFLLLACSSSGNQTAVVVEQPEDSVTAATIKKDSTATPENGMVDGVTSATNVANGLMLNGTMIVPAENNVTVTLPISGIVTSFTKLPGEFIRKGDVIVVLENTEFIDLQQSYLDAVAQSEYLETEYKRQSALSDEDATSKKRVQQSRADYLSMKSRKDATAARLKMLGVSPEELRTNGIVSQLKVKASQSGYISDVMVNQGKYVAAGEAICQIINKTQILLDLIAYEKDLNRITVGKELQFKVNGVGEELFEAVVTAVDQRVDPVNRSVKVFAKVVSTQANFRPGMYVIALIK